MKKLITLPIATLLVALVFSAAFGQQGEERRPSKEKWEHINIQATIEAIDLETRELILRGPKGNLVTVVADERVQRLNEFKVGDIISADYWIYIMAEFRDPTPEEMAEPLVILAEAGKAPKELPPAAAVGAVVKAVVTIEIINRPDMEVTVRGPRGNYVSFPATDQALLEQLNVGEIAIMTYAEALALSLEKVDFK
jgi:hypothetical protein